LDIGVLGYIGIVQHKEHSPEVLSIPPGTPCMCKHYENSNLMGSAHISEHIINGDAFVVV